MPSYDGNTWSSSSDSESDDESALATALQTYLRLYLSSPDGFMLRPTTTCTVIPPSGTLPVFTGTGVLEERTAVIVECLERRNPLDDIAISNPAFNLTTLMPTLAKLEYSIEVWIRTRSGRGFHAWKAVIACKDANGAVLSVDGEEAKASCQSENQWGNCHVYQV